MKKRKAAKSEHGPKVGGLDMTAEDLLAFYWTVKDNAPARDAIDWGKFAEQADWVGLHYHPVLGLMEKRVWNVVKEFVVV